MWPRIVRLVVVTLYLPEQCSSESEESEAFDQKAEKSTKRAAFHWKTSVSSALFGHNGTLWKSLKEFEREPDNYAIPDTLGDHAQRRFFSSKENHDSPSSLSHSFPLSVPLVTKFSRSFNGPYSGSYRNTTTETRLCCCQLASINDLS